MPEQTTADLDPLLARIFAEEIRTQYGYLVRGVQTMGAFLLDGEGSVSEFWFGMDASLGAMGNVSKIFWPSGKGYKNVDTVRRCEFLRRTYDVDEDSPISNRKARDAMEHFDERLDAWYASSTRRNFLDSNIGPKSSFSGMDNSDFLRSYDPSSDVLSVAGDDIVFFDLADDVKRIAARAAGLGLAAAMDGHAPIVGADLILRKWNNADKTLTIDGDGNGQGA